MQASHEIPLPRGVATDPDGYNVSAPAERRLSVSTSYAKSQAVTDFIREFDRWVFHEFQRAQRQVEAAPAELAELVTPWVCDLRQLAVEGGLQNIRARAARKLRCLIKHVLDGIEGRCRQRGESPAEIFAKLPAIEDMLIFLSLKCRTRARKLCARCHERPALSSYRGKIRFRRDHDLCRRCWRSAMDRFMATAPGV